VQKFAANLTMLFGELPFLDRFAAAKAAGFSGVEYLFPYDFEKAALREQLQQHGLTQVLHNLPAGDWAAGERGIAILPDRIEEFHDGVISAIDYAKALDCRQLNCLVGIAPRDADAFELSEVLVDNLRFAADALAKERIKLLIEPINTFDIPGFFLNRTEQAVQILSEVKSDNLFIQYGASGQA
jgi:hydroxypyruvate isomerase